MIRKAHRFFVIMGILLALISIVIRIIAPGSIVEATIFEIPVQSSSAFFWLVFSFYSFLLAGIYFLADRSKLKFRRWMVIIHYISISLFLILSAVLNISGTHVFREFISSYKLSILTLLSIYVIMLAFDFLLFIIGLISLFVNLIFAQKAKGQK